MGNRFLQSLPQPAPVRELVNAMATKLEELKTRTDTLELAL
jgi:hypothetical protein